MNDYKSLFIIFPLIYLFFTTYLALGHKVAD